MNHPLSADDLTRIESVLLHLEDCAVECDGMTYAISYLLHDAGIAHQRMVGAAISQRNGETVFPHCWITLAPGVVVDYRLRMWLGDDDRVPHGVFDSQTSGILYRGDANQQPLPSFEVLMLLTDGRIDEVTLRGVV